MFFIIKKDYILLVKYKYPIFILIYFKKKDCKYIFQTNIRTKTNKYRNLNKKKEEVFFCLLFYLNTLYNKNKDKMQYQNKTGNQRPFSVNNPFRNISQTQQDVSLKQYETDEEFQQWVKQNQQFANGSNNSNNNNTTSPYNSQNYGRPRANRSNSSFLSQRSSAFYDDEFFDQYDEGNSNNNNNHYSNGKENGNKLEFQPPKSIYQYVTIKKY